MEQTELLIVFVLIGLFYYAFADNPILNQKLQEFSKYIQKILDPSSVKSEPELVPEKKEDCKDSGTEEDKNKVFTWNETNKKCSKTCATGYTKSKNPRGYCVKSNDSCANILSIDPDPHRISSLWEDRECITRCASNYYETDNVCVLNGDKCKGPKPPTKDCLGKNANGKIRGRQVDTSKWTSYKSTLEAATELALDHQSLKASCNNREGKGTIGGYEFEYTSSIMYNNTEDGTCASIHDEEKCNKTTDEYAQWCIFEGNACKVDPNKPPQTCYKHQWVTECTSPTPGAAADNIRNGVCVDSMKSRTTTCERVPPSCKANYVGKDGEETATPCCGHTGAVAIDDICPMDLPFCRNSKCSKT